jgi:surfeit locus 1 family protein
MTPPPDGAPRRRWSLGTLVAVTIAALALSAGFFALGVWQVERLAWKRALIAAVDTRLHAAPVAAPGPGAWSAIGPEHDAYRRVMARGVLIDGASTFVQATTDRGGGYWVMTPLRTDRGFTLLVNRGFIPPEARLPRRYAVPVGPVVIAGLLRITEPKGGLLRRNEPVSDRWYSRDIAAIATARKLTGAIAPYFIDAAAGREAEALPIGGLTVVRFPNNHLVYAVTWFLLAAMVAGAYIMAMRWEWTSRRASDGRS